MYLIKCKRTATWSSIISHIQSRNHKLYQTKEIKKSNQNNKNKTQTKDSHHLGQIQPHLMQPDCWIGLVTVQV